MEVQAAMVANRCEKMAGKRASSAAQATPA
jgi:hypothetical protein